MDSISEKRLIVETAMRLFVEYRIHGSGMYEAAGLAWSEAKEFVDAVPEYAEDAVLVAGVESEGLIEWWQDVENDSAHRVVWVDGKAYRLVDENNAVRD